jgi:signal transduction histidine kinase
MLLLARQEEGRLTLSFARVDLYAMAKETIHAVKPVAKARGLRIQLANEPETPIIVLGDRALLRRLIDNMLTNAIKFSPSKTEINVELGVNGTDATLDVDDEGPGVPEEMRKRIFEKFEIVKMRAAGGPQTGLGLAFCRTVVEAHGGYITCLPRSGRGARFRVTLPIAPPVET